MEKREKIISKIQKVLELSRNNPSKEEAQAAALMAQKLLAQYHISVVDIEEMEKQVETIEEVFVEVGRGNKWKGTLAAIIAKNFRCKVYTRDSNQTIVFYGYELDASVAANTFEEMFYQGVKLANKFKRTCTGDTSGVFNSYVMGFCSGLREGLERQCTALMIVTPKEVEDAWKDRSRGFRHSQCTIRRSYNSNGLRARQEGYTAGRNAAGSRLLEG